MNRTVRIKKDTAPSNLAGQDGIIIGSMEGPVVTVLVTEKGYEYQGARPYRYGLNELEPR